MGLAPKHIDHLRGAMPDMGRDPAAVRRRLETMEQLLERAFTIPGINRQVGLDSIVGLVPVVGDMLTAAMGDDPLVKAVLLQASDDFAASRLEGRESATTIELHLTRSRARAAELEEKTPAWVWLISTDGKDVPAVASEILERLGWL